MRRVALAVCLLGVVGCGGDGPAAGNACGESWQSCPVERVCVRYDGEARCWPRCHYTPTAAPCESSGACSELIGGAVADGVCLPVESSCLPLETYFACH